MQALISIIKTAVNCRALRFFFFFNYYELSFKLLVENLIGMMVEIDDLSQDSVVLSV